MLDGWGVFYFATHKEAEEGGNQRIRENILKMRELGYAVDTDGGCRHVMNEDEAKEYNAMTYGTVVKKDIDFTGKSFKEAFLDGEVSQYDVDKYIEYWHTHDTNSELREYLGLDEEEFVAWVKYGTFALV